MTKLKITFRIHYNTKWGDKLLIIGSIPQLGNAMDTNALAMHWEGDGFWRVSIELDQAISFTYKYVLKLHDGNAVSEFGERTISSIGLEGKVLVNDTWLHHANAHNPFFTTAFTQTVFRRLEQFNPKPNSKANVRLCIRAPRVPKELTLCVSGSSESLGRWDTRKPLLLNNTDFPNWECAFYAEEDVVQYKFAYYDLNKKEIVQWEDGSNRLLELSHHHDMTVQNDEMLRIYNDWRGAGVAIPVFSIRTGQSMGCGEFVDLKSITDWCVKVGMKMLQILPINDTISTYTWRDSYPYNAISVNALHPIYLHVPALFKKTQTKVLKEIKEKVNALNAYDHVNYEAVLQAKLDFANRAFLKQRNTFKEMKPFKDFVQKNEAWLGSYAAYSAFRDTYHSADFNDWGDFKHYNKQLIRAFAAKNEAFAEKVDFYVFIQYHLDKQLSEAVKYARTHGIIVKGDIPIGINRYGVEAWQEPNLFSFDQQAGAPPDDFSVNGQNWGFPTYNWAAMEKAGYTWWEDRFKKMSDYFDAYRIDHILGFFRIWEIPLAYSEGLMGHFNPSLPVSEDELRSYGIEFDFQRFCTPYISFDHIYQQFGNKASLVIETFMDEKYGRLQFKPEFDSEAKLLVFINELPEDHVLKGFKDALRFYHYEVLLIPDEKPGFYHPRISMHFSRSFQHMPQHQQQALNNLYVMFYYHRHNDYWGYEGHKKLAKLIESTNMLVCGEDLGMVPSCVEGVMDNLQILSLEVQRMPKDSSSKFGDPYQYPKRSVCTPATHDMSTIRGWWEENRDESQAFFNGCLQKWGEAPEKCEPWLNEEIVKLQLNATSMLTVLSMQDWLNCNAKTANPCAPEDERINIPKNPRHYWKYRMHLSVEELQNNEEFNDQVKRLVAQSGRE